MAWGTVQSDSLRSLSIPGLVKRIAIEAPDKIACSRAGQCWSYGQLDATSLFLARLFNARGLRAGDEVPIFLSRCFESVASIIALMRLGVCFVPMDAESWSQGRVDAVLKAVQPKLVVYSTSTELQAAETSTIPAHVIRLSCEAAHNGTDISSTSDWIDTDRSPDEPIYIIFTSGTTGQPKGVVIPRRCIENYVRQGGGNHGMPFNLGVHHDDRVLLLFSLAFDAAWGVFFSTLCWGGELVLSQPDKVLEDAKTCTILPATPSLLLSLGDPQPYQKVRSIFLGGETPYPAQIQQWSAAGRRIYNCYGPSECSICVSMAELRPGSPIVLGEPMEDTQLLILDDKGEVSDEGELGITGPGLAAGYYKNPELTSERFVTWRNQRLYRTLDRARRIPEGIVFCGRKDSMVKNRGFLINIDLDVLPALQSYPGVVSAAAFTRHSQLMAIVTPDDIDTADMRRSLSEKYDSFVVPDQIHACSELPRTANGKVDIQLLHSLVDQAFLHGNGTVDRQSQTPTELLHHAVAAALRLPPKSVPMDRSFWELGGNSLLAVRLLASLHENGYTLAFEDIFGPEPLANLALKLDPYQLSEELPNGAETTASMTLTQLGMVRSSIRQPGASYMLVSIGFPWTSDAGYGHRVRDAWKMVMGRHVIFRTYFDLLNGVQKQDESSHFDWREIAVSSQEMSSAIEHESQCLWDSIRHGEDSDMFVPVNALRLLVSNDREASLLWLVHHSLVDGWSIGTVIQEVQTILAGENLTPQRLQFLDFSQRLPQHLQNAHQKGAEFWKELLFKVVDASPLDLPKPIGLQTGFGQVKVHLEPSFTTIEQLCAVNKVTPATVFHAAWALLLRSYTPQDHVVFGTVFSGRDFPLPGIHSIVGPTLNTCPFPVDMTSLSSKAAFLAHVHSMLRLISTHQWSAAGALQEHMPGSHARILQTVLFLEYDLPGFDGRGWHFDRSDRPEFGLTVSIQREDNHLSPRILFDRAVYTEPAIQRMASHLCNLVHALLDPRCVTVADVRGSMLDTGEFLELTGASSTLMEPYIGPSNLKTAFECGVDRWPDAVAVETRSKSITYRELDQLANCVAQRISYLVQPGSAVAIVSDRSLEWVIAVMAVIKAGTVYVPLDTKLPIERMRIMLETSCAKLCLFSSRADSQRLGKEFFHPSLCVPDIFDNRDSNQQAGRRLSISTQPSNAAYITFTSGSTGVPKGVCITHQSVVSYLAYGPARMDARPGRRHAQMFSPGFDVNQAEIFGTLCFGATLVLADPDDPFAHLSRVHATMITPSFLSVCAPDSFPNLDTILFAGEAVPQALADLWSGQRTVYNSYGPCECTIGCLFQPLQPHTEVTLGRTIPRVGVYILDEDGRPVPRGVPGEICLSGIQIAGGYIGPGMETLSQARFVADPFVPGLSMYRTGDCAVWTEDMEPRFQGRFDNQIKIRGFRVELTEIENVIRLASPDVRRAAAVVQGDIIVAFVEPETVHVPTIQAHLHTVLPAYACPSKLVALPTLPTMPNQKLDRKKLQAYSVSSASIESPKSLTSMQHLVAEAWKISIGLPDDSAAQIDAESDFLALGGSSLSQIRVAQIVCQRLDTKLPLKLFLWNTTLSILSDKITEHCQQKDDNHLSFQQSWKTVDPPFNMPSYLEREFVLLAASSPTPQTFNVAVHLQLTGDIDLAALENAAVAVMAREPILHSCFQVENGTVMRCQSSSPCEIIREEQPVADLDDFVCRSFDLSSGPLSRLLLRQQGNLTSIVLVQHHAITDKSAMQTFFRRLQTAYMKRMGHDVSESDLQPDYTVWAQWKSSQDQAASPILQGPTAEYWKTQLADLPAPLFQQPPASTAHYVGKSSSFSLEPSQALPGSMELFVALVGVALAKIQGTQDVIIGIPHVDRTEPGTEDMLGIFLDRLPIRFQVASDNPTHHLPGLVQSVGSLIRDALSHSMPFQDIRKMSNCDDIFQVMVVYNRREDAIAGSFSLPGTTTEQVSVKTTGAKFPLLVEFTETQNSMTCELEYMEHLVSPSVVAAFAQTIQDTWSV